METWEEFAVVTGGAAAALTGLLFVAVSIRLDVIAASTDLRSRAAQTLTLFLSVTLVAVLFAIPGQPEWLFGVELIALAIVCGVMLFVLARRARRNASQQTSRRSAPYNVSTDTSVASGSSPFSVSLHASWSVAASISSSTGHGAPAIVRRIRATTSSTSGVSWS